MNSCASFNCNIVGVGNPCAYRASISLRVGLPRAFRAPGPGRLSGEVSLAAAAISSQSAAGMLYVRHKPLLPGRFCAVQRGPNPQAFRSQLPQDAA